MLLMCFALLGAAASRALKLPGLLVLVSLLAVAIGLEGALSHRALSSVLLNAVLMLATVEFSYLAASLLWDEKARSFTYWKV
jgi:NADH:ubiquinone oxidoreductase subunit K